MPATIEKKNEENLFFHENNINLKKHKSSAKEQVFLANKKINLAFVAYMFTAFLLFTFFMFQTYLNNKKNNQTEVYATTTKNNVNISDTPPLPNIPPLPDTPISFPEITPFVPDIPIVTSYDSSVNNYNYEKLQKDYDKTRELKAELEFQKYHTEILQQEANQKMIINQLHTIGLDNLYKQNLFIDAEKNLHKNSYDSKDRILSLND